jgi:hypothetical protein
LSTIAFEKRWNPLLAASLDDFVASLTDVASRPAAMAQIVAENRGLAHP